MANNEVTLKLSLDNLAQFNRDLDRASKEMKKFGDKLENEGKGVEKKMGVLGVAIGTALGIGLSKAFDLGVSLVKKGFETVIDVINKGMDFEEGLISVKKTVGFTREEMEKFGQSLLDVGVNTRTSYDELLNIATIGGQIGVAKGEILDFTFAVDKLNVALSDEFAGGAEEITRVLGTIASQVDDIGGADLSQEILRIGNALNVLGSTGLATGNIVSDMTLRMLASGKAAGVSTRDLLAFSATLQETGISSERAATSMAEMFGRIPKKFEEILAISKKFNLDLDATKFKDAVNNNMTEAIFMLSNALNKADLDVIEFESALAGMGFTGGYITTVLKLLGQNTDKFTERANVAGEALKGTDSIMAEFNDRNTTAKANLEKLGKQFERLAIMIGGPVAAEIGKFLEDTIIPFIERHMPEIKDFIADKLIPEVKRLFQVFRDEWPNLISRVKEVLQAFTTVKDVVELLALFIQLMVEVADSQINLLVNSVKLLGLELEKTWAKTFQDRQRVYEIDQQIAEIAEVQLDKGKKIMVTAGQIADKIAQTGGHTSNWADQMRSVGYETWSAANHADRVKGSLSSAASSTGSLALNLMSAANSLQSFNSQGGLNGGLRIGTTGLRLANGGIVPGFAKGGIAGAANGIIGGNSTRGDKQIVGINSGEMVINRNDQNALFNFIKTLGSRPQQIIHANFNQQGNRSPMQEMNNFAQLMTNI